MIVSNSDQEVTVEFSWLNNLHRITFVYASVYQHSRRALWTQLRDLASYNGSWLVLGDFNAVTGAHERMGGNLKNRTACREFCEMIDDSNLIEIETTGSKFTWSNGRASRYVESRLDRALCNSYWIDAWNNTSCFTLPRHHSDHNPIVVQCEDAIPRRPLPFRFKAMWSLHPDFHAMVDTIWRSEVSSSSALSKVMLKLKLLKSHLRVWNKNLFGDVNNNVRIAADNLERIQLDISRNGFSTEKFASEMAAHHFLEAALKYQASFLQEKARIKWLENGDRNTAFLHRMVKIRNANNGISMMTIDGVNCFNINTINSHVVGFFQNLFLADSQCSQENFHLIKEVIPELVTVDDNRSLTALPSLEEIKNSVFALDPKSAPGPEGFNGLFFNRVGIL